MNETETNMENPEEPPEPTTSSPIEPVVVLEDSLKTITVTNSDTSLLVPIAVATFDADDDEIEYVFPDATLKDFGDEVPAEERKFCLQRYADLTRVKMARMHCTACNKHLGLSASNVDRLRMHPLLRTLVCEDCLDFYNSGEFSKGEDGSELYCRWCGQGGQVFCCSSCPVVFCEKCIKRNFGPSKITDIKSIDDWNCFICSPKALWCHRAALWAARRYCNLKNAFALKTTSKMDSLKKQRKCQLDESVCCKRKKTSTPKQKLVVESKKSMDSKIQNKKSNGNETLKRRASPLLLKTLTKEKNVTSSGSSVMPMPMPMPFPLNKKFAHSSSQPMTTFSTTNSSLSKKSYYRKHQIPVSVSYNGIIPTAYSTGMQDCYSNFIQNDNLNLSLESLTQGLDMSTLNMQNDDNNLVCTPDFPLPIEPLCEVTEKDEEITDTTKNDDDVQCLTPPLRIAPKPISSLMSKTSPKLSDNIIQMSEKDVSINKITGGLKFRVDPSTLSTSKKYQLPDGRIFAVNINPKMPGGYSATIVNNNDPAFSLLARPGLTVKPPIRSAPPPAPDNIRKRREPLPAPPAAPPKFSKISQDTMKTISSVSMKKSQESKKSLVMKIAKYSKNNQSSKSIEWYTYNLLDAVDLANHITQKLNKLKEVPTMQLRNKPIREMKDLHYSLDQILKISCQRLQQIRNNLNTEFKDWLKEKCSIELFKDELDDDDNVEITSDSREVLLNDRTPENAAKSNTFSNSETIFIDENSNDSTLETTKNETRESSPDRESPKNKTVSDRVLEKIDDMANNFAETEDIKMDIVENGKETDTENEVIRAEESSIDRDDVRIDSENDSRPKKNADKNKNVKDETKTNDEKDADSIMNSNKELDDTADENLLKKDETSDNSLNMDGESDGDLH